MGRMGSKQAGTVTTAAGDTLFISYQTIIGIKLAGESAPTWTAQKHSPTTSRHQALFLREHGGTVVEAVDFHQKCSAAGYDSWWGDAPVNFKRAA